MRDQTTNNGETILEAKKANGQKEIHAQIKLAGRYAKRGS